MARSPTSPSEMRDFDPEGPADDGNPFGTPESEITLEVDVTDYSSRSDRRWPATAAR